jgi:hypothetical protein
VSAVAQPLVAGVPLVAADGSPTQYFMRWAQQRQQDIASSVSSDDVTTAINAALAARQVLGSDPLAGGGALSADVSLTMAPSGVTPGQYANPVLTADRYGRVTAITAAASSDSGGTGLEAFCALPDLLAATPPDVSAFTVSGDPGLSSYALNPAAEGVSLYASGTNFAFADLPLSAPAAGADIACYGLIRGAAVNTDNWAEGITLGDGTGRRLMLGYRNTQPWVSHSNGTNGLDNYQTFSGNVEVMVVPTVWRIRKTSGTIYYEIALDGENFDTIWSESATAYLTDTLTTYGLGVYPVGTTRRIMCHRLLAQ